MAQEVQDALDGLQASLPRVQTMLQWKNEKKKVPINTQTLKNFVANCRENIVSTESHLSQELKKEAKAKDQRELQRMDNETKEKARQIEEVQRRDMAQRSQRETDRKARQKQEKVDALRAGWQREKLVAEKKRDVKPQAADDGFIDNGLVEEEKPDGDSDAREVPSNPERVPETEAAMFDDSDDDDDDETDNDGKAKNTQTEAAMFDDSDDDDDDETDDVSESESDEELVPSSKREKSSKVRSNDGGDDSDQPTKKRRITEEDSD